MFALMLSLSFFFGAPFVTTPKKIIFEMITLAKINKSDVVIDLGSGDGRVLFETAKLCKKATGYEINLFLVLWTKLLALIKNTGDNTDIFWQNYHKAILKKGTVIFMYSIRGFIPELEKKLKRELRPGTKIISYKFPLHQFKLVKKTNSGIFLYSV